MAKKQIHVYDVYWSPTGAKIATVEASTAKIAKSKAPAPYRKYKGEIYVEDRGPKENRPHRKVKKYSISRKVRESRRSGDPAKVKYHAERAYGRMVKALAKPNAPKLKRKAPKGWIKAKGVKIRRRGGRVEVLIRK